MYLNSYDLATRYIALWTEPDPELRRKAIQKLWSDDGVHILQPPADLRERAGGLGFDTTMLEAHGYDALEVRVMRSHAEFVAPGQYTFQARDNAARLHNGGTGLGLSISRDIAQCRQVHLGDGPGQRRRRRRRRPGSPHPRHGRTDQADYMFPGL